MKKVINWMLSDEAEDAVVKYLLIMEAGITCLLLLLNLFVWN